MNELIELIEYNRWANEQLLNQIKDLTKSELMRDTDGSFPSLLQAILHLLKSDWTWLERWKGNDFIETPEEWRKLTIAGIENVWGPIQSETIVLLKSKEVQETDKRIIISDGSTNTINLNFRQTVNIVVNHGTYYRGQIVNMIEMLGVQSVRTQLLDYYTRKKKHLYDEAEPLQT